MSLENLVGQTLNRYNILSLLGEGGMGAVFKAHDVTLQRDVAVKVMHPHFARQPDFRERFLQEARTAARMAHPAIVQVYDFGQANSLLYIVMEFIPGANLNQLLTDLRQQNKWLVLGESIEVVKIVGQALDYAHKQGVLHRDIKPANIMLKPEPEGRLPFRPVLTDLGLAKLLGGQALTQEGTSMGTPAYMSPEQALGETADARSDVYSLGVLLYELSTGKLPFPARNLSEAVRYHTKETPPAPRTVRPDLPASLETVILKAMAKVPDQRYATAGALAAALEGVSGAASPVAAPGPAGIPAVGGMAGAVSLSTQFEQSASSGRGASVMQDFAAPSSSLPGGQDRIQVLGPDKSTKDYEIKSKEITIGRDATNAIVLPTSAASRHHAKLTFDGTTYQVVDLNSTNGTYLGTTRLLPGIPEAWSMDKAIRIGDYYLRLVKPEIKAGAEATAVYRGQIPGEPAGPVAPRVVGGMQQASMAQSGGARVSLAVPDPIVAVEPGRSVIVPVTLFNQGTVVDHFQLSVEGIPGTWIPTPIPSVQMMPGDQKLVNITIMPPRTPESRAGDYPLQVKATSKDTPQANTHIPLTLKVSPFSLFTSQVFPQKVKANKTGRVSVANQGNYAESYTVNFKDRGDEMRFSPPVVQLNIPEGESVAAEFIARPRKRPLIGANQLHPFTAEVLEGGVGMKSGAKPQSQVVGGEIISTPIIPTWLITLMILACIGMIVIAGLYIQESNRQATAYTATAAAIFTANAAFVSGTDTDGDGLPDADEVSRGTNPNQADTDSDGINDKEEVDTGTNPALADTDGDGLKDGDEKRFGTNPQVIDTDGDTVSDGEEVNFLGSSPTKDDTDGDGLKDNVDPSPGQLPTPTPQPTATPQPSATPQATGTAQATLTATPQLGPWHGTWDTSCEFLDCQAMTLTHYQLQPAVTGTFANGNGTINGTVQGRWFSGEWSLSGATGTFDFWMLPDSSGFQGNWDKVYSWCGSHGQDISPCGLASWGGAWDTSCGVSGCETLTIIQTGASATGIYAGGDGTLEGTIEGTTFSGNWTRGGTGTFKFYMQQNGTQFNGNWDSSNEWCGYREGAGYPNPCLNTQFQILPFNPPMIINPILINPILFPTP